MKRRPGFLIKITVTAIALLLYVATGYAAGRSGNIPLEQIRLPWGFKIDIYAADVPDARSLALSPGGTLFIGTRKAGKVYAVLDRDGDFRADEVVILAKGLNMPNGVAFKNEALYVAEVSRVLRYDHIEKNLDSPPRPAISPETVGSVCRPGDV